ncbi:unnamed protein product [Amoebophrya sp. A25]|nr:unnamed protein product [Amoebophrya sp. A25]|eukprot:GSA25T00006616001.1
MCDPISAYYALTGASQGEAKEGEQMFMTQYDIARVPELAEIVFIESQGSGKPFFKTDPAQMDSRLHAYFTDAQAWRNGMEAANKVLQTHWGVDGYFNRLSPAGTQMLRDITRDMVGGTDKTELQFWVDYNQDMCKFDIFTCAAEPAFKLCIVVPMEFNPKMADAPHQAGAGRKVYKLADPSQEVEYCTEMDLKEKATVEVGTQEVALVLKGGYAVRGTDVGDGWIEVGGDLRKLYLPLDELAELQPLEAPGQAKM